MSLETRLQALITAIGSDIKALQAGGGSTNTAARIVQGAALTLYNNPRTREADASVLTSIQQLNANPSAVAPTVWEIDPADGGCVCAYNGGAAQLTGSGVWFPSVTYNISTGQADLYWRAETETDGDLLVVSVTSWSGAGPRIIVDGTYYSADGLTNTSGVGVGSQMWLRLNFPDARKRRVAIEGRYDIRLIGISSPGNAACTRPADNSALRMIFVGDSNAWMYGYDLKGASYGLVLADCLGIRDVRLSAISGTGLQATNGGANYNYGQRIADVTGVSDVDLVVFAMSWNDWNYGAGFTASQIKTAAAALITATRAAHPNAVVLFHGVNTWDIAPADETGLDGHEAAVQEAVSESSDPLVGFIPVRSAAGDPILYGGSTTPGTHANRYVNTSIDHMTPDGNNYVGRWLADRVFSALVQMSGADAPAVLPAPEPVASVATSSATAPTGISNYWFDIVGRDSGATNTTRALTAGEIRLALFRPERDYTLDAVGIKVSTAATGSTLQLLIYDADADGYPANLIYNSTEMSAATAIDLIDSTTPVPTLVAGAIYYVGTLCIGGGPTVQALQPYDTYSIGGRGIGSAISTSVYNSVRLAGQTSAPASWSWDPNQLNKYAAPCVLGRFA